MTEEDSPIAPDSGQSGRKPFGWPFWLLLIGTGVILYSFVPIRWISIIEIANRKEATTNAKQIRLALFAFEEYFGAYPSTATATEVTAEYPSHGYNLTGNSSNAIFRQLFAAKVIDTEMPFYVKIMNAIKPDGIIIPREALKKGEVGFAYISGLSTAGNPNTPILLTPMIPGTTKFDPEPFDGKAIALRIDGSVTTYKINKDGHIYDKDGDVLSPKHPFWNGKTPTIHYPE